MFDFTGLTPAEIRTQLARFDNRLRELHQTDTGELRALTAAEQTEFDEMVSDRDAGRDRLARHQNLERTFERGATEVAFGAPEYMTRANAFADDARAVLAMGGSEVRSRALKALEQRGRDLPSDQVDQVDGWLRSAVTADNPYMDGSDLARRLLISESDAYRSAFSQIMASAHPILTAEEAEAVRAMQRLETRAMSEGSGPTGSFGLPVLIDPSIMLSSGVAVAPIMDIARTVPTNTNVWKGVSSAPPVFSWDAEASGVSDDSPTLAQPLINVWATRGWVPYSIEVGQDYPNFATEMADLLAAGYIDIMASTTATGTGSAQPWGVFTRLDATTTSEVRVTTAGQLGAVDVFKAWNAVPERFRSRASWVMSVSAESQIRSFSSANQSSAYFTVDLTADGLSRLNGRPVVVTDYAPTFVTGVTSSANFTVVGDFQHYVIARRIGLQVEPIQMLFDTNARPTGQRGFFAYARAGADVTVTNALRLLNQT